MIEDASVGAAGLPGDLIQVPHWRDSGIVGTVEARETTTAAAA